MSKLNWQAKAAKRELAEAGLRQALVHIEAALPSGGPTQSIANATYGRALYLVRHAAELLRQSEGE